MLYWHKYRALNLDHGMSTSVEERYGHTLYYTCIHSFTYDVTNRKTVQTVNDNLNI